LVCVEVEERPCLFLRYDILEQLELELHDKKDRTKKNAFSSKKTKKTNWCGEFIGKIGKGLAKRMWRLNEYVSEVECKGVLTYWTQSIIGIEALRCSASLILGD